MAHDDPFAGKTVNSDWAYYLDTAGTYTPALTAATTNPNLGDTGTAAGAWQRSGHLITGWARFQFNGTGVNAGSGGYEISLPFDADLSIHQASNSVGAGDILGSGFLTDLSTSGNAALVVPFLAASGNLRMARNGTFAAVTDSNVIPWAAGDLIIVTFAYIADPADLPS